MFKQRIVGFLVIASLLAIFLPYLYYNKNPFPSVSSMVIPREQKVSVPEKNIPQLKAEIRSAFNRAIAKQTGIPSPLHEKAWSVRLASFSEATNASNLVQKLRASGYSAYQRLYNKGDGMTVFHVCVGPVLSLEKAKLLKEQIRKQQAFQSFDGVIISFRPLSRGEDGRL